MQPPNMDTSISFPPSSIVSLSSTHPFSPTPTINLTYHSNSLSNTALFQTITMSPPNCNPTLKLKSTAQISSKPSHSVVPTPIYHQ